METPVVSTTVSEVTHDIVELDGLESRDNIDHTVSGVYDLYIKHTALLCIVSACCML